MKKLLLALALLGLQSLGLAATPTPTVTPVQVPQNLRVGVLQPDNTIMVFWDLQALSTANAWRLYFNGKKAYDISASQVAVPTPGTYAYLAQNLPQGAILGASLSSLAPGRPESDQSLPITFTTAAAPFGYQRPAGIRGRQEFTTIGLGAIVGSGTIMSRYTLSVCGANGGTLNDWVVSLHGSLDGQVFTDIMAHLTGSGACVQSYSGQTMLYRYLQVEVSTLTPGTTDRAVVYFSGMP